MDCCRRRVKVGDLRPEEKWDFISLNDFKTTSCFAYFAYGYLWVSLLISVAVYAVDTFTAVNLLAFNRWSGEIEPAIPFKISKWIFAGCIIASWVNLGYEHLRAMRVMKRGSVAESFLDSLAVRLQCIRVGKGRGYRRFLVFAELTKSKKGAEYVALFTYFSFQAWIRIIFCQGPRQVINALTLYSVYNAKLDPNDAKDVGSFLSTFFKNIGLLASEEKQQAVVLSGMVFTLVIWIFGALSLLLAAIFWLFFLWHYIPNADGSLTAYCERKVTKRLARIVSVKVNKAIAKEEERRNRADAKAIKKGEKPAVGRQATLPVLFDAKSDDKLPQMPMLGRNDTTTTLPLYSSRPGTPSGQPPVPALELNQLNRPYANRTITGSSTTSNAPLLGNAADMGYGRSGSPSPSLPNIDTTGYPQRPYTSNSNNGQRRGPGGPLGGPPRMPTAMGDRGYTQSPVSYTNGRDTPGSEASTHTFGRPAPRPVGDLRSNTPAGPAPSMGRRTPFDPYNNASPSTPGPGSEYGRSSPAPRPVGPGSEYGRNSPAPRSASPAASPGGYQAYNPGMRSASAAPQSNLNPNSPSSSNGRGPAPYRNMTDPGARGQPPAQREYIQTPQPRPGTGNSNRQMLTPSPARLASPSPYNNGGVSPGFGPLNGAMDSPGYRRS